MQTTNEMPFALRVATKSAELYMASARMAKKNNRQSVVAHYVKQARHVIREGRRGEWGTIRVCA